MGRLLVTRAAIGWRCSLIEEVPMSDTPVASEKVGRGLALAALAIPLGVLAGALVGGLGLIGGLAAIVVGPAAGWLYTKGAGAPLRRSAWVPFLLIGVVGVLAATAAGTIGEAYAAFSAVSGDGGVFGSVFATTVATKLANGDLLMPILVGLGLGTIGLVGTLRAPTGTAAAPVTGSAPAAAPPAPPAPNAPSPGVILNGEPVDPDAKA